MVSDRKLELAKLYTETARSYSRRYRRIQEEKHDLVLSKLPAMVGRLLDVGCGMGDLLAKVGERAKMTVGVDISPGMVRASRGSKVNLIVADADLLPFADESFDCVVSVTMLQNMPDPEKTVREMKRVVRPGGLVIVTALGKKHPEEELVRIMRSAGLLVRESGRVGEDFYCVCKRPGGRGRTVCHHNRYFGPGVTFSDETRGPRHRHDLGLRLREARL
jgi:ubiquinone/menaquinone biosynthesis C-methylase UbiE